MENIEKTLTLSDITRELDCPAYVVQYLIACRRLPIARETRGQGFPRLYYPEALDVVREHLGKRKQIRQ